MNRLLMSKEHLNVLAGSRQQFWINLAKVKNILHNVGSISLGLVPKLLLTIKQVHVGKSKSSIKLA